MQDISTINPNDPEAIAESMVPVQVGYADDQKSRYLALIACGFKMTEAVRMVGIHLRTAYRWRDDPTFLQSENQARGALRKKLASEHLNVEFTRNYALALQRDWMVLGKSVKDGELTKQEHEYLLRARNHYTPQQLQILQQLISTDGASKLTFEDVVKLIASGKEVRLELTQNRMSLEGSSGALGSG